MMDLMLKDSFNSKFGFISRSCFGASIIPSSLHRSNLDIDEIILEVCTGQFYQARPELIPLLPARHLGKMTFHLPARSGPLEKITSHLPARPVGKITSHLPARPTQGPYIPLPQHFVRSCA